MVWPFDRYRRYRKKKSTGRLYWVMIAISWALRLFLVLLILDLFYLANKWPDWEKLKHGAVPKSNFIKSYIRDTKKKKHRKLPRLQWRPVNYNEIPSHMVRAVVVAEDSRFFHHGGFDLIAFREAMGKNLERGRMRFGASTISQQTVKNMFLSAERSPLRKWHELLITWGMEQNLKKDRIMEIYLNIAEFGFGIYGVEAASRHYWGKSVSDLSLKEAAELAACLPSPKKHNPSTRTSSFERRVENIHHWLTQSGKDG